VREYKQIILQPHTLAGIIEVLGGFAEILGISQRRI
jgi:hypothetical protein